MLGISEAVVPFEAYASLYRTVLSVWYIQHYVSWLEVLLHGLVCLVFEIQKVVCRTAFNLQKVWLDAVLAIRSNVGRPPLIDEAITSSRVLHVVDFSTMADQIPAIRVEHMDYRLTVTSSVRPGAQSPVCGNGTERVSLWYTAGSVASVGVHVGERDPVSTTTVWLDVSLDIDSCYCSSEGEDSGKMLHFVEVKRAVILKDIKSSL